MLCFILTRFDLTLLVGHSLSIRSLIPLRVRILVKAILFLIIKNKGNGRVYFVSVVNLTNNLLFDAHYLP